MTNPGLSGGRAMLELAERERKLEAALMACLEDRKRYATKLSQARGLLREMVTAHRADIESYEYDGVNDYAPRVWRKVEMFLAKRALRARAADTPSVKP